MRWQRQRKAFSMITAIFIIVLMATVSAFILNLSGKMTQETTAQFQREQSMLLAKSYTEYAVMAVTANEHNTTNCLDNISGSYSVYSVDVNISYIGDIVNLGTGSSCSRKDATVTTADSPLNIIVDVFVSYPEFDNANINITYHKRSLQKI